MAESVAYEIPYERQSDPLSNRMCGAAALCMVYRSFGFSASQAELAPKLRGPGESPGSAARSYLLAQDALARGLGAVVLRLRDPLRSLRQCQGRAIRLILNHRLHLESPSGHFTVLVKAGEREVIVHDPQYGANTSILLTDLVELWRPQGGVSEISGNVLIALANGRTPTAPCPQCRKALPESLGCPVCGKAVPLHPAAVLGCMDASCSGRAWEIIFCPYCDASLVEAPGPGLRSQLARKPAGKDDDPMKLKGLNEELDKFIAMLQKASKGPHAAYLQKQITTIRKYQADLIELQKPEAAQRQAKAAPPPTPSPEPVPPPEPSGTNPRPPVDWNELGRKLVEEIRLRKS
jgi:hypothetical protein